MHSALTLLLAFAPAGLHFLGDHACPDQASVEAQVRRIDPGAFESKARHLALLEPQASGLEVRLFDDDGHLLERRLLDGSRSCPEWARIAAALLALAPYLEEGATAGDRERALFARAACRTQIGDGEGSRTDLRDYLCEFPQGRFAAKARAQLARGTE